MEWIDVKTKLPPIGKTVLLSRKSINPNGKIYHDTLPGALIMPPDYPGECFVHEDDINKRHPIILKGIQAWADIPYGLKKVIENKKKLPFHL
jgi:hypothetical protein